MGLAELVHQKWSVLYTDIHVSCTIHIMCHYNVNIQAVNTIECLILPTQGVTQLAYGTSTAYQKDRDAGC